MERRRTRADVHASALDARHDAVLLADRRAVLYVDCGVDRADAGGGRPADPIGAVGVERDDRARDSPAVAGIHRLLDIRSRESTDELPARGVSDLRAIAVAS